jgi:ketosteroid isomerase-like protein
VSDRATSTDVALDVVDTFLTAYNGKDLERIAALLADGIHMVHYGRDIDIQGAEGVLALLARSAEGAFPDRSFHSPRRRLVDGQHVIVEHAWSATAEVDVPGYANAGEKAAMDLCTIFTVKDGRIVEYVEYG